MHKCSLIAPKQGFTSYKKKGYTQAKSLERSPAVGDFYGTRIEIWAGFGPVRQILRSVFSCFHGQKIFFKNILDGENIFGIE